MGLLPSKELHDKRSDSRNKLITILEGARFETHFSGYTVGGYWDPVATKAERFEFNLQHVCLKPPFPLQQPIILKSSWVFEFRKIDEQWQVKYSGQYHHSFIHTGRDIFDFLQQCGANSLIDSEGHSQPFCWHGTIEHSTDWLTLNIKQRLDLLNLLQSLSSANKPTADKFINCVRLDDIRESLELPNSKKKCKIE